MNSCDPLIHELQALFRRPVNSDTFDVLGVRTGSLECSKQRCGEIGARRQFRHPLQAGKRRDGHDSCEDGYVDPFQSAPFLPVQKHSVVEEHLTAKPFDACVDLPLQVIHLRQRVRGFRVSFRKTRGADRKPSGIGVRTTPIEFRDAADQIRCIGKVFERIL